MENWNIELEKILKSNVPDPSPFRDLSQHGLVLYGAGSMGLMALDLMRSAGKSPEYFVDKNPRNDVDGIKVIIPEKIPAADLKNFTFIICIATIPVDPIFDYLKKQGCVDVRHFYDYSEIALQGLMTNGWVVFEPDKEQIEGIKSTCKLLDHDKYSIAHYMQFLWWRLRRKEVIYPEWPVLSHEKYFTVPSFPVLTKNEIFVDGGAHFGSIITTFNEVTRGQFNEIIAFEPDLGNQQILEKEVSPEVLQRTRTINKALLNVCTQKSFQNGLGYASKLMDMGPETINTVTLDSMSDISPTIIKLHIEGDELSALEGSVKTITNYRPIVMTLADHDSDGLYRIADFFKALKNYTLFFYLHDYCGNSAIYYAYPNERLNLK